MTHFQRVVAATSAVVAVLCFAPFATAQVVIPGGAFGFYGGGSLGDYDVLMSEYGQKEAMVTPEQVAKLKDIAKKYLEEAKADWAKTDWTKMDWTKMSNEERNKLFADAREKQTKRAEQLKKDVEAVLVPNQVETAKQLSRRMFLANMLYRNDILDKIGFNEKQKEDLQALRKRTQDKMQQLQYETIDETVKLLTDDQKKQLEELRNTNPFGRLPPGAGGAGG